MARKIASGSIALGISLTNCSSPLIKASVLFTVRRQIVIAVAPCRRHVPQVFGHPHLGIDTDGLISLSISRINECAFIQFIKIKFPAFIRTLLVGIHTCKHDTRSPYVANAASIPTDFRSVSKPKLACVAHILFSCIYPTRQDGAIAIRPR